LTRKGRVVVKITTINVIVGIDKGAVGLINEAITITTSVVDNDIVLCIDRI